MVNKQPTQTGLNLNEGTPLLHDRPQRPSKAVRGKSEKSLSNKRTRLQARYETEQDALPALDTCMQT